MKIKLKAFSPVPDSMFAIARILLLAFGRGIWNAINSIGAEADVGKTVLRLPGNASRGLIQRHGTCN